MRRRNKGLAEIFLLMLCMGFLTGCSGKPVETVDTSDLSGDTAIVEVEAETAEEEPEKGGTLVLKVNPEIAVEYDQDGKVTAVRGRNEEGKKIVEDYQDYMGKECHEVVEDLVQAIHSAGYFVEEVEGAGRKITIEIETGSIVPEEGFLDEIVTGVQDYVKNMQMSSPVVTEDDIQASVKEIDIYDHEYGAKSYESAGDKTEANTGTTDGAASVAQPPAVHESPYTDYETPYTDYDTPYTEAKPDSPYTDYETPYTESKPDSPYTDYETPYTESKADSPYTDYESPYEDSSYSHYEGHSSYSDYD